MQRLWEESAGFQACTAQILPSTWVLGTVDPAAVCWKALIGDALWAAAGVTVRWDCLSASVPDTRARRGSQSDPSTAGEGKDLPRM